MDIILAPGLSGFTIGFVVLAALCALVAVGTLVLFFADNHAVRVRRHESIRSYYGHLAHGH
jgi:hypothetical protein